MKLVQHVQVVDQLRNVLKRIRPDLLGPDVLQGSFGLLGIIPEIGLLRDQLFIFYFKALTIVVKDTSSRRSHEPSSLSTVLLSLSFGC
jgi:hypothetical protein